MAGKRAPTRRASRPLPQPSEGFIAIGWVTKPRGARGELAVVSLTDVPERFQPGAKLWVHGSPRAVRRSRTHRDTLLIELEGIDTRSQAEALRDALLEVPERELPTLEHGQYFHFDVVGIEVVDQDGRALGRVIDVLETGANDVYIVRDAEGELLLPAIDSVVKRIDIAEGRMVVEPLPGLVRRPTKAPRAR